VSNSNKLYSKDFYIQRERNTGYAASTILEILFKKIKINSALDLGCGNGVWLSELEKRGVSKTIGVDGPWVPRDLYLSNNEFIEHNFIDDKFEIQEKFDVVISLEMFEHIPQKRANELIETISSITDCVLFSAAIPNQGGNGHINEQWLSHWVELFRAQGFYLDDTLRPVIWNDFKIPYWYRQNIVLFDRNQREEQHFPIDIIHPETLIEKTSPSIRRSILDLFKAIINKF
jgi:SAM-dependent methyltransferase